MRHHLPILVVTVVSILHLGGHAPAASINDFVNYTLLDSNNNALLRGLLHVPAGYATDPGKPRPLILFLHGAGESGTDNRRQINGNIDNLLAAAKARDAFLYAPQTNSGWSAPSRPGSPCTASSATTACWITSTSWDACRSSGCMRSSPRRMSA